MFSANMVDVNGSILDAFTNCVSTHLYIAKTFCSHIVRPLYYSGIVVVDLNWSLVKSFKRLRSFKILIRYRINLVHSSTAPISACAELCTVYVCRFDIQLSRPPSHRTWPVMDLLLKRSRRTGSSFSLGTDWS